MHWQPTYDIDTLKQRAEILAKIRDFFARHNVLEVDTQLLSRSTITDTQLSALSLQYYGETFYLQTSPEYAMKRLLAAGAPDIYQLGKVFRADESGRIHNPEFTMLEWYRHGLDHFQLMQETEDLLHLVLNTKPAQKITYKEIFQQHFAVDPHLANTENWQAIAKDKNINVSEGMQDADSDTWQQLLFTHVIEPSLGFDAPVFVYDFPASQCALAKTRKEENYSVAERFEVYVHGIELANGYHELTDCQEQQMRFEQDNAWRLAQGLPEKPIDLMLMQAMKQGLPECSGIALGVDRLIMLALDKKQVAEVLPFSWSVA
jgi:lysyl-tRNA synthetase class 2